jgi:S-adenosylmethionine synthetase
MPIWLAHKLARGLTRARTSGDLPYLAPDGKSQVAVEYRARKPHRVHSITIISATQDGRVPNATRLRDDIMDVVVKPAFKDEPVGPDGDTFIFVNPGGPFRGGGPGLHSGLTGRKSGVDTYGEYARQSDSALSGKDPSRIDRVGAYAARYAARNVITADLADECEIQISYTIGRATPVSMQVETFATGRIADEEIAARIGRSFDFRLANIIRRFNLRYLPALSQHGFYRRLAAYGHVGRTDLFVPWETNDLADALRG